MEIITVGRSPENDIVLEDKKVSAKHLALSRNESGEMYVQDLGSTNGTWVNGKRVGSEPFLIFSEDQIQVGDTLLPWFTYFSDQTSWKNRETIADQKKPEIFPEAEASNFESENKQDPDLLQNLQKNRRKKDDLQKNRILWISLMVFLVLFIGLLLIWYFSFIVTPELNLNTSKSSFYTIQKFTTVPEIFREIVFKFFQNIIWDNYCTNVTV